MPNWCGNTLHTQLTNKEMIKQKLIIKQDGDYYFNLHKLYPEKYWYFNINFARYILYVLRTKIFSRPLIFGKWKTRSIESYMMWLWDYDWCCENLWTKWYPALESIHEDIENDYISFESAWSPPEALIKRLSYHVWWILTLEYEEPGMAFEGTYEAQDGETYSSEIRDYISYCECCDHKEESVEYREDNDQHLCDDCYEFESKNIS